MVDLAWKISLKDKLRFAITVSGVAFAVLLVLVQVGLFLGLLGHASVTIERARADLWVTPRNAPNVDFAQTFPESYVDRVRAIPGVKRADALIVNFMKIALPSGAREGLLVYAMEDFSSWNLPWDVSAGDLANLRRGRYYLLDESAARRFGALALGDYQEINDNRFKLIGRTRGALSFTTTPIAFIDHRRAQAIADESFAGRTSYILVALAPGHDAEAVRAEIQRVLPWNEVLTRAEWAARSRQYWVASTGLGLNMYLTVFLGCLIGIVVVAQTLYTSTMEHQLEFGTVKAIGGSNAEIYGILLRQATFAAASGFPLGLALTSLLGPAMSALGLNLTLPTSLIAITGAATLVLCWLAAAVSFRRVAAIDPALVLRA